MARKTQDPVETVNNGETTLAHPAFGQIVVSRVSGQRTLYGSDFQHHRYVLVSLHQSTLCRHLSTDWTHAGEQIVQFALSEAKWAAMVSSFGSGEGTQVTIERIGTEGIPEFPLRDSGRNFKAEGNERIERSLKQLENLRVEVTSEASGLSKAKQAKLTAHIDKAIMDLGSNLGFVAEQFGKHLETRVEKAKIEINAYMTNTIMRAGLKAIANDGPLSIEGPNEAQPTATGTPRPDHPPQAHKARDGAAGGDRKD